MSFKQLCVVVLLAAVNIVSCVNHEWEMAVVVKDKIELLNGEAATVGIALKEFNNLKAITYDDVRHQFIVSDMNQENDTIYGVRLSDSKNAVPIIADIPDDVKDVAVDSVDNILYWTDYLRKKIMWLQLNQTASKSQTLFEFKEERPLGIAIDSCRRKIYWTNSNYPKSTIERANLDGTEREVIVKDNIFLPAGITIDHGARRIYWADKGEGIYFRIESARFDGSNRRIVYEDTHQKPFGIAVSETHIYWTDLINDALQSIKKGETGLRSEVVRRFTEQPIGLVARNNEYQNIPECHAVSDIINRYNETSEEMIATDDSDDCLNYGYWTPNGCKCRRGYAGPRCEINLCHNYCFNGRCYLSNEGYPKCACTRGYLGDRCEFEVCRDYCLNGGTCRQGTSSNDTRPVCECQEPFSGTRCETMNDPQKLCSCEGGVVVVPVDGSKPFCRCNEQEASHVTIPPRADNFKSESDYVAKFKDPLVMVFMFATILLLLVICTMTVTMCKMRHRRPRINKRIIVNKNVTPMTCRPNPPTEQCEITIENCCNMNICETPCFEPSQIRGFQRTKTEEKKTLLTSMENGEDLY